MKKIILLLACTFMLFTTSCSNDEQKPITTEQSSNKSDGFDEEEQEGLDIVKAYIHANTKANGDFDNTNVSDGLSRVNCIERTEIYSAGADAFTYTGCVTTASGITYHFSYTPAHDGHIGSVPMNFSMWYSSSNPCRC